MFRYAVCKNKVHKNSRAVDCDCCSGWCHVKCGVEITDHQYKELRQGVVRFTWTCVPCSIIIYQPEEQTSFFSDEPSLPVSESTTLSADLHEYTSYWHSSYLSKRQLIRSPSSRTQTPPAALTAPTGAHQQLNETLIPYVVPDTPPPDISLMADVSQHSFVVPLDVAEPDIQGVPAPVETAELSALTFAEICWSRQSTHHVITRTTT